MSAPTDEHPLPSSLHAGLRIRLFGGVSILLNDRIIPALPAKALELFCYLLLNRDRAHTREILCEVLWPGHSADLSRRYLRQALWKLKSAVPLGPADSPAYLVTEPEWVRVNLQAPWWLDVSSFERAYANSRDIPGRCLTDLQAQQLTTAASLYQGELLATWYQDWCVYERERLQQTYLAMLDQLMGYCEMRRLYATGLAYGEVILRHDRAREATHRQMMLLHYGAGDRTAALRQYERCVSALTKEFGIGPSRETGKLYEQIRADGPVGDAPTEPDLPDPTVHRSLMELHTRLDDIAASLFDVRHFLQQERGWDSGGRSRDRP